MSIYYDKNNIEYKVGDIVCNTFAGDYWVVVELTDEEKKLYDIETDLGLALYNDKDYYCIAIDEPVGFEIVMSIDDDDYLDFLKEMKVCMNIIKESLKELSKNEDGNTEIN